MDWLLPAILGFAAGAIFVAVLGNLRPPKKK